MTRNCTGRCEQGRQPCDCGASEVHWLLTDGIVAVMLVAVIAAVLLGII